MAEASAPPNEEILSVTSPQNTGPLSNHQSQGWKGMMTAEEMEVLQAADNRAFFEAVPVSSGNVTKAESMLRADAGLAMININGMHPIHIAASLGHSKMTELLFYQEPRPVNYLDRDQIVRLFITTLKNNIFGVSFTMIDIDPTLARSRDEEQLTPLHVLARKSKDSFPIEFRLAAEIFVRLCRGLQPMERHEFLEFISTPSQVLFDAARVGNLFVLDELLKFYPELLMMLDSKRRTLFHIVVLYRQPNVSFSPRYEGILKGLVMLAIDDDGNNILHMAGMISPDQRFASSRPDNLMQQELLWFKEVEKRVPIGYKSMRNKEGQTPKDIFYSTHKEFMISANLATKDKANYGMLVATIIATIVFAASLTVPGHDVSPDAGSLIFKKQAWFVVFIVSNSVALFSSSASTIFFLTVLTSSFTEDEFNSSLLLRLTCGVTTLFVAITTMVVAFVAACFLIFNHHSTWVAYLVALLGFLTVACFVFLPYTLFRDLINTLSWSRAIKQQTYIREDMKTY